MVNRADIATDTLMMDLPDQNNGDGAALPPNQASIVSDLDASDEDTGSEKITNHDTANSGPDHAEEVQRLLSGDVILDDVAPPLSDSAQELTEVPLKQAPAPVIELEQSSPEQPLTRTEVNEILESLKDSLINTRYISEKIEMITNDTECLIKQVNNVSTNLVLLTAEIEPLTSDSNSKNSLSKSFLIISSVILVLLVVFQIFIFIYLNKIQRLQNTVGSAVYENMTTLNKKMADYDKHLTKAMELPTPEQTPLNHVAPNQTPLDQVPPHHTGTEITVPAGHENREVPTIAVTPVFEKLNKMRDGLAEKKLIRKESGDWFVYNKKGSESIADVEVIKALNEAYRKIGRSTTTNVPMPPHNALCLLKPDGKGGTLIIMTKEFVP